MQENSPIKQRILQYLDNKGISRYKFYKETGITRGILDQNNGISEENIHKFLAYAQDISIVWLVKGEGGMYNTDSIPECSIQVNSDSSYIYKELLLERDNKIDKLNRQIGKLEKEVEILKKGDEAAGFSLAAEPKLKYKGKE